MSHEWNLQLVGIDCFGYSQFCLGSKDAAEKVELSILYLESWSFVSWTDKVSFVVGKGDSNLYLQVIWDECIHALKRTE